MYKENELKILDELKTSNPEVYNLFINKESEHKALLRKGCHDILNIISLINSSYQLLEYRHNEFRDYPMWNQIGSDLKMLIRAMNMISYYRYSDNITIAETDFNNIWNTINSYIKDNHKSYIDYIQINKPYISDNISTDAGKLCQAVEMLIDNAVENSFNKDNPSAQVTLNISFQSDTTNQLVFSVRNTGAAPNSEIYNIMFDPFTTDKNEHIGLGLTIASNIVASLHGKIEYIRDDTTNTTCFCLKVPC